MHVFLVLAFAHRQRLVATLFRDRIISLLLGLAILSTLWSDSPSISLWEDARLIATTFFAIYLAKTYSLGDIFHMVAWVTALVAVLSIIFALALPQYGLSEYGHQPVWTGVFDQKNDAGQYYGSWSVDLVNFCARSGPTALARSVAVYDMLAVSGALGIRHLAGRRVCIALRDCGVCESASVHPYSS